MPSLRLLIDTEEKIPLLFPRSILVARGGGSDKPRVVMVETERLRLETGDYTLEGHEATALVERKGSISELAQNLLTADYRRHRAAFARLSQIPYPYLLLEGSPADLLTPHPPRCLSPESAFSAFCAHLASTPIRPILVGRLNTRESRLAAGTIVLHLLHAHTVEAPIPA